MTTMLKWLHILSMFVSVTLLWAPDVLFWRAARSGDVATMRGIGAVSKTVVNVGIALFFVGIGFGIATAVVGPFDLTEGWLLTAYGLVALLIVLGAAIENPHYLRMSAAAERSGDEPSEELRALLRSPIKYLSWVSVALYAAVIYVMVAKPFG